MQRRAASNPPPNSERRLRGLERRDLVAVVSFAALVVTAVAGPASAQLEGIQRALTRLETDVDLLIRNPVRKKQLRSDTFVEERLTDGELFFRLKDYLRASIIFTDIVEHYPNHRAYPDAVFLLGESLFFASDYYGARTRFSQVIDRASRADFRPFVQRALGRLIEIAIHTQNFEGIEDYFRQLSVLPQDELETPTAYFKAKYHYSMAVPADDTVDEDADSLATVVNPARLEEARRSFLAVPDQGGYAIQAKYFVGVIHTLRGELPEAIQSFRAVLGKKPESPTPEEAEVLELTYLALGRLYYETDELEQAIDAYQAVPRTSANFERALYEIAWVYIRRGDATLAERALEVLAVAAPDSALLPDAKVLRGKLLQRGGRYDDALAVFGDVRAEFGPVYDELTRIRDAQSDLGGYFRRLVRDNMEDFDVNDFLPASARRWTRLEGSYQRALGTLSDLSTARRLVRETDDLIVRLTAALRAPNRASLFADLRNQRERTTALRNRLVRLQRDTIRAQAKSTQSASGRLQGVRTSRSALEGSLDAMPISDEDFAIRDNQVLDRYDALERELGSLQVQVLGLEARISAASTVLGWLDPNQPQAAKIEAEVREHEKSLETYRSTIVDLRRAIEVGRLHVGVGDPRYQKDDEARRQYQALVQEERKLAGAGGSAYESAFTRIDKLAADLDQRDGEILAISSERVSDIMRVVAEEEINLRGYRVALRNLEGETEDVVGAITHLNFNRVRDRFFDVVLRADVGQIDVAWARREEHRMRIDLLTRERAGELQALDDEFQDVMDDGLDGEGGK